MTRPTLDHTSHNVATLTGPRLTGYKKTSRPIAIELVRTRTSLDTTNPRLKAMEYEDVVSRDYSDADSEDHNYTPQEWVPKLKLHALTDDHISLMKNLYSQPVTTETTANEESSATANEESSATAHLSSHSASKTNTKKDEITESTLATEAPTNSAKKPPTNDTSDDEGYCLWEEWNLPRPTGVVLPETSKALSESEEDYVNEGLGPVSSKLSGERLQAKASTFNQALPTHETNIETKSGESIDEDDYVNEGLGPIAKPSEEKVLSRTDSEDDDGYFIMESLNQSRLLSTSRGSQQVHEEASLSQDGSTSRADDSHEDYHVDMRFFTNRRSNLHRQQVGHSFSIDDVSTRSNSAYTQRRGKPSPLSYHGDMYRPGRQSLPRIPYPSASAFNMQTLHSNFKYSRNTTSLAADLDKHEYTYIELPKRKHLQSVSEWVEGGGSRRAESVGTRQINPAKGTLV